jgi:cell division protein ZapB
MREYMQKRGYLLDPPCNLNDSSRVDTELASLEAKVAQFVSLCERLRAENTSLRQQLAVAQNDAKRLHEKIDGAKSRLEGLISRLPAT